MSIKLVIGDVLESKETWLVHQCNCVTRKGKGLSEAVFKKYPYANVYKNREDPSRPGLTLFRGKMRNGERLVANLMSQFHPGKASNRKTPDRKLDTEVQRLVWFTKCLSQIAAKADKYFHLERSVAVPFGIGCGLAGGDWMEYQRALKKFSEEHGFMVVVYKLDNVA